MRVSVPAVVPVVADPTVAKVFRYVYVLSVAASAPSFGRVSPAHGG